MGGILRHDSKTAPSGWTSCATWFAHFSNNSRFNSTGAAHVPAGEYTLWTLSSGDTTELIISHETGQWGTDYDESRDLGRTAMMISTLDTPAEQLTLYIEDSVLRFEWGATVASVPIMVH